MDDCLEDWIKRAQKGNILDCSYQPPRTIEEARHYIRSCKQVLTDPEFRKSVRLAKEIMTQIANLGKQH